jgi:hypothetical protein
MTSNIHSGNAKQQFKFDPGPGGLAVEFVHTYISVFTDFALGKEVQRVIESLQSRNVRKAGSNCMQPRLYYDCCLRGESPNEPS